MALALVQLAFSIKHRDAADVYSLLFVPLYFNKPDGIGIGSYIVQEIASTHHGWIDISSKTGVGDSTAE